MPPATSEAATPEAAPSDLAALLARLAAAPMRRWQVIAIALCVALNALDGFDVLSISFAAPGIAREWAVGKAALGFVLSYELIGMATGSIVLGQVADRIGRRTTAIGCLMVMALGMGLTMRVGSLTQLAGCRLLTGLGIGGMLAVTNALVAEYANDRWRSAAVAVMAAGYPLGAIVGGAFVGHLLASGTWRSVFGLGLGMSLMLLPLAWMGLPEPIGAGIGRARPGALARLNAALARLGEAPLDRLPPVAAGPRPGLAELFAPALRRTTVLLILAYFLHVLTFYFILKWTPKIVADMGWSPAQAAGVLVWANVGGLAGGLAFSALSLRVDLRRLITLYLVAAGVTVAAFGQIHGSLATLSWAVALGGFCTNGAIVGLYALIATTFPTALRSGGTGLVIGIGRMGAALGPIVAGYLFAADFGFAAVATIMAGGALGAAVLLQCVPRRTDPDLSTARHQPAR